MSKTVPGGSVIVGAVDKGIKIIKGTKINLKDVGQAAIDAAAANIAGDIQKSADEQTAKFAKDATPVLALVGVGIIATLLLARRGR